jgi:hypothetical protein
MFGCGFFFLPPEFFPVPPSSFITKWDSIPNRQIRLYCQSASPLQEF